MSVWECTGCVSLVFHQAKTCTHAMCRCCRCCGCVGSWLLQLSLSLPLTFQLADLRLTVRPLLVTVHFILMKKSRSVLSSLPFLPKPLPETQTSTERGNEAGIIKLLLYYIVFYCDGAKWNNGIKLS